MGTRIEIEPGYESALAAAGLRTFDDFLNAKAGAPVSKHRHRETVPIEIAVGGVAKKFFLKRVFRVPPRHSVGPLLAYRKPLSQPASEWLACEAMRAKGLPAMKRVAYGEKLALGIPLQAFLLVEASQIRHSLEEWLAPGFQRPRELSTGERTALLQSIGRLARVIGSSKFIWRDLDSKHILAESKTTNGNTKWDFCLIDLERVKPYRGRASEGFDFEVATVVGEILASLSPLSLGDGDLKTVLSSAGITIEQAQFVSPFYQVCVRDHPRIPDDFVHPRQIRSTVMGNMTVDERFAARLRTSKLGSLDDVFHLDAGKSLSKPGLAVHRDRIRLNLPDGHGSTRTVYLKRYHRPPLREQLRRIRESGFKRSSARIEARFTRILWGLGLPTMTTIAWGQDMSKGFERRSFLITDEVPGESLEKIAATQLTDPAKRLKPFERFEVIRQLALLTRNMHVNKLFHRDLYLCHVFLSRNENGDIVLRLIDLARMIARPFCNRRWEIKDLAALNYSSPTGVVTRADRARFMYHYLAVSSKRKKLEKHQLELLGVLQKAIDRRNKRTAAHDERRRARLKT